MPKKHKKDHRPSESKARAISRALKQSHRNTADSPKMLSIVAHNAAIKRSPELLPKKKNFPQN